MAATGRKTAQFDLVQLNALNFLTSSNTAIPSSFVLAANGDGTTSFNSISSLTAIGYTSVTTPGQAVLNSSNTSNILQFSSLTSEIVFSTTQISSCVYIGFPTFQSTLTGFVNQSQASTNYNFLTYPNINSTIQYQGNKGVQLLSTVTVGGNVTGFSSFQYNFSNYFSKYINPNGSSKIFLEFYPNFNFSPVITPSSISSTTLYPEGNSSIKNIISISSHLMYTNTFTNSNIPVLQSGVQQYVNINSSLPYAYSSSVNYRPLSNSFIQPMQIEMDPMATRSNFTFTLMHYISDGTATLKSSGGLDVFRSGFERNSTIINNLIGDKNSVFIHIANSGNQF